MHLSSTLKSRPLAVRSARYHVAFGATVLASASEHNLQAIFSSTHISLRPGGATISIVAEIRVVPFSGHCRWSFGATVGWVVIEIFHYSHDGLQLASAAVALAWTLSNPLGGAFSCSWLA